MALADIDHLQLTAKTSIHSAHDTLDEAKSAAAEVFTCVIAAVGKNGHRDYYLRPAESKDPAIIGYVLITMVAWGDL